MRLARKKMNVQVFLSIEEVNMRVGNVCMYAIHKMRWSTNIASKWTVGNPTKLLMDDFVLACFAEMQTMNFLKTPVIFFLL